MRFDGGSAPRIPALPRSSRGPPRAPPADTGAVASAAVASGAGPASEA